MEEKARAFAEKAHFGQKRKYSGKDYITHPAAVVKLIKSIQHTEEMTAAAWLHDVVEDTKITLSEIETEFGKEVAELVEMLTDISEPSDGNRKKRKEIDRKHTAKANQKAKTIKLADLIDNTKSITKHDPKFALVYLEEKRKLLEVLKDGDPCLFKIAKSLV